MRIGILTCHWAYNYGAVLQAYALSEMLSSSGHDVQVVDYQPSYVRAVSKNRKKIPFAKQIKKLLYYPDYRKSKSIFSDFLMSYMKLSINFTSTSIKKCEDDFDCFVVGSDQVWNPNSPNGHDPVYQLAYTEKPKVAYAASIGIDNKILDSEFLKRLSENLEKFTFVSTREKVSCDLLQSRDLNCKHVCDPVLLLEPKYWDILCSSKKQEGRYILTYVLHHDKRVYDYAKKLAAINNCKLISVTTELKELRRLIKDTRWNPDVNDFLNLVRGSYGVVTNSYHGMLFSLIFRRPLHVCVSEPNDIRIYDFIRKCKLEDRIINSFDEVLDNCKASLVSYDALSAFISESKKLLDGIFDDNF